MRASHIATALAITVLTACRPTPPADASVELARSDAGVLSTVEDGDAVELVFGPQGGYHLDVGVWMRGVDPDGARLRYEVWEPGVETPYHYDAVYALRAGRYQRDGDAWMRADRALLDITDPGELVGRDVDVLVFLELADGSELADARTLRVVDER